MNDFKMSSETTQLVEICKAIHSAWHASRAMCEAAKKTLGHGEQFDNAYDEAVTASSTFSSLSITTLRAAVSAIESDLLTDPSMAGLLAEGESRVKQEAEIHHGHYITDADAKTAAAYTMAWDFVVALVTK